MAIFKSTIIAHRGAPFSATENTLSSFRAALDLGVSSIELDVHLTKDGRLAVHHDYELGRTIDGRGEIADMTLSELKELRVKGVAGAERIPALEEVFSLCRGRCHLAVEAKADRGREGEFAAALVCQIRAFGDPGSATVISFNHSLIQKVRELDPDLPAGPSFSRRFSPDEALPFRPSVVVAERKQIDRAAIGSLSKKGIPVWAYTVDDLEEGKRLDKAGVSGIITNRPDLFLAS